WIANPGRRPSASRHDGRNRDFRLPAGLANLYSMGRHAASSALPRRRKLFARWSGPAHLGPLTRGIEATDMSPCYPQAPQTGEDGDRVVLDSAITCPHCGMARTERMPVDACQIMYVCTGCGVTLRPKPGDCCVFCSFGSVPCPPAQIV